MTRARQPVRHRLRRHRPRIGERRPRFAYTAGLKALGGTWDAARMDQWLANPRRMVPGTTMAFAGVPDPKDRADVIAYLSTQGP